MPFITKWAISPSDRSPLVRMIMWRVCRRWGRPSVWSTTPTRCGPGGAFPISGLRTPLSRDVQPHTAAMSAHGEGSQATKPATAPPTPPHHCIRARLYQPPHRPIYRPKGVAPLFSNPSTCCPVRWRSPHPTIVLMELNVADVACINLIYKPDPRYVHPPAYPVSQWQVLSEDRRGPTSHTASLAALQEWFPQQEQPPAQTPRCQTCPVSIHTTPVHHLHSYGPSMWTSCGWPLGVLVGGNGCCQIADEIGR